MDRALGELQDALTSVGHRWVEGAEPGLSLDAIQTEAARVGLTFPDELAALWQWHAGGPPTDWMSEGFLPGGFFYPPLSEVIDGHVLARDAELLGDDLPLAPTWVPAIRNPELVFWADTGTGATDAVPLTPIVMADIDATAEQGRAVRIPSVAAIVRDWARMLTEGYWGRYQPFGVDSLVWCRNPELGDMTDRELGYTWAI
jgi:hypothetical protein